MMERRQEAAVLRYMRQISELNLAWPLDDKLEWVAEPEIHEDFRNLDNCQIAKIMADEQQLLEGRLRKQVETLRGMAHVSRGI